jgi:hypothetical protein
LGIAAATSPAAWATRPPSRTEGRRGVASVLRRFRVDKSADMPTVAPAVIGSRSPAGWNVLLKTSRSASDGRPPPGDRHGGPVPIGVAWFVSGRPACRGSRWRSDRACWRRSTSLPGRCLRRGACPSTRSPASAPCQCSRDGLLQERSAAGGRRRDAWWRGSACAFRVAGRGHRGRWVRPTPGLDGVLRGGPDRRPDPEPWLYGSLLRFATVILAVAVERRPGSSRRRPSRRSRRWRDGVGRPLADAAIRSHTPRRRSRVARPGAGIVTPRHGAPRLAIGGRREAVARIGRLGCRHRAVLLATLEAMPRRRPPSAQGGAPGRSAAGGIRPKIRRWPTGCQSATADDAAPAALASTTIEHEAPQRRSRLAGVRHERGPGGAPV